MTSEGLMTSIKQLSKNLQKSNKLQELIEKYNGFIYLFIKNVGIYSNQFTKFANRSPYMKLMHLHQSADKQLLMMPILWTLVVACSNVFQFLLFSLMFIIAAVIVYGIAGITHSIVDRNSDKEVEITKNKSIIDGELSVIQAVKLLTLLFGMAIVISLFLPRGAMCLWLILIMLIAIYPFIKKWYYFSSTTLIFVSNLGVFIAWFAVHKYFSFTPLLIYFAAVLWAIGYKAVYKHQYEKDDVKNSIKSTATMKEDKSKKTVKYLYGISISLLGIAGLNANLSLMFFPFLGLALCELNNQIDALNLDLHKDFQSNINYGLLILITFIIGKIL